MRIGSIEIIAFKNPDGSVRASIKKHNIRPISVDSLYLDDKQDINDLESAIKEIKKQLDLK